MSLRREVGMFFMFCMVWKIWSNAEFGIWL